MLPDAVTATPGPMPPIAAAGMGTPMSGWECELLPLLADAEGLRGGRMLWLPLLNTRASCLAILCMRMMHRWPVGG
jgi:hypothetical protein